MTPFEGLFVSCHLLTTPCHGILCSMTHHCPLVVVPVVPVVAPPPAVEQEQPEAVTVLAIVV